MPIYEYACQECGEQFETMTSMSKRDRGVKCPECGGKKVERKLSVFAAGSGEADPAPPPGMCGRCGDAGPCAGGGF